MTSVRKSHNTLSTAVLVSLLTLTFVLFAGQMVLAGPGCGNHKAADSAKTDAKADAKAGCAAACTTPCTGMANAAKAGTTDAKKLTKEECIAKCVAQGMTAEQAEKMWAKHCAPGTAETAMTKEECMAKCMAQGMTKAEAETCWEKQCTANSAKASATTTTGCPGMAGMAGMQKTGATVSTKAETCTKDECIDKLIKAGFSKEDAEKKYTACMASGKCTGSGTNCCLKTVTK